MKFSILTLGLIVIGVLVGIAIIFLVISEQKNKQHDSDESDDDIEVLMDKTETKKTQLIDYNTYVMTISERLLCIALAAVVVFAVGYVFYRSIIMSLIIMPIAVLYPKIRSKQIISKRKQQLSLQFKECLYSLSSSLSAGKSIESAFRDALKDLSIQYPDSDTFIINEIKYIVRKIEMNETIEAALQEFAGRSHLEDIQNFADVFETCKRTGGNMVQVIRNSTEIINDKIETTNEIQLMLVQKKFEQKVLSAMPIGLILMLSISAKDFMEPVFTQPIGKVAMTIAIILFVIAYFISDKIMNIEV